LGVAADGKGLVPIQVYLTAKPTRKRLVRLLAAGALGAEVAPPSFSIERLPDVDWVAESQKALTTVCAGRFYLHGAHDGQTPPAGSISLLIEANQAFGTGHHESTRGCLLALDALAKRRRVGRALDMGCGSGVLAMAVARLWRCPVLAVDNDPDSVRIARANAALNRVAAHIETRRSDGYRFRAIRRHAPYDLIVANILAEPLMAMSRDLRQHLAYGGTAVLSGLLVDQARPVLARHVGQGLRLARRIRLGDWMTLVLEG
jgi:ribosomal protein L11 methyltransferase